MQIQAASSRYNGEMITIEHLKSMQTYIANVGITASALRGLGGPGFVGKARDFCANLDLKALERLDPSEYWEWLVGKTNAILEVFQNKQL